ncbi:MAG: methionyl-tRNA formyltransferase [Candidatus Omnitrophica bacterium]|nr:methionyl-tRNA formyltransferase [Candidatus Omnitrophota bacterium]
MKIIFFGSDDFAAESLRQLLSEKFSIVACVTQPDRPSGRGLQVVASPIKQIALKQQIPVLQPDDVRDSAFLESLRNFAADLFVVIAYGKILPACVLQIPKIFCVNVHGSLLPKYRGAAPINWAIIRGETQTGFSLIKMNSKMDAGEIIVQGKMSIAADETAQSLRSRMAKASAQCLCPTIKNIADGQFSLTAQNQNDVSLAPKLSKELGHINWNKPAGDIHNVIRGLVPWPGAYTSYQGKIFKVLSSAVVPQEFSQTPGTILTITKEGIIVATSKDALVLKTVHPQSGKEMPAYAFAVGQRLSVGSCFG